MNHTETHAINSVLGMPLHQAVKTLAERVDQVTAERDRARDIAARLEHEVAMLEVWTVPATDRYGANVGVREVRTHHRDVCQGRGCPVHHHSGHHMAGWPQLWRGDRCFTERTCPHGIGHPDPDDPTTNQTHGCDGCCATTRKEPQR